MTYVIQEDKHFVQIERYVHGMDVVTAIEPVQSHLSATEFDTKAEVTEMIDELKRLGNDVSKLKAVNKQEYEKQLKEEAKRAAEEAMKEMKNEWAETDEKERQDFIDQIKEKFGEEAATKWLDFMKENK